LEIHISVRNLVEFIMRSGDIDSRRSVKATELAMQEGREYIGCFNIRQVVIMKQKYL